MNTALITGAAGFIGTYLTQELVARNWKVVAIDNLANGDSKRFHRINPQTELIISDVIAYHPEPGNFDYIFDLAYINGTRQFYTRGAEILEFAGKAIFHILQIALTHNARLIYFSTPEIYGEPKTLPTPETEVMRIEDIRNPRWSYAIGKIFSESVLYSQSSPALNFSIVRPNNAYGPYDRNHVIPDLCEQLKTKPRKLSVLGQPSDTRSYCFVTDMVKQIIAVAEKGETRQSYNVGNAQQTTLFELVRLLQKVFGTEAEILWADAMPGSPHSRQPSLERISSLISLNFTELEDGLRLVFESATKADS